jgi:aminoglycoside phosphotransferase family enzyme/predicted kinase
MDPIAGTAPVDVAPGDQSRVIDFLALPETHGVRDVQCLETHGNLVFLAGDNAYKIKRAVRFEYMDFSTLEKRRIACHREVEINRQWAPDLYLGCVAIVRRPDGSLSLEGAGEIVEWAVHMRRFDQNDLLSVRAEHGQVDRDLSIRLAQAVFSSHSRANRACPRSGIAPYRDLVASISRGLAAAGVFDPDATSRLASALQIQLARSASILNDRAEHGLVRRCHGDLHLANIVLHQGQPTLYDALEFDEVLATIDTLYDLAFLLMDLDVKRQRPAANVVLNRYLLHSADKRDLEGLTALPLFLTLRAGIRALVTSDRVAQEDGQGRERDLARARQYFATALAYATPAAPRLIVVAGLSGTGKTTLAGALAPLLDPAPGAVHLRSDLERKVLAGVGEFELLPASAYTPQTRGQVYRSLHEKAASVLRARHSVVLDAVYDSEAERRELEDLAASLNVPMHGLWLHAKAATLIARVEGRRGDASDATADVVRRQLAADIGRLSARWSFLDAGGSAAGCFRAATSAIDLTIVDTGDNPGRVMSR